MHHKLGVKINLLVVVVLGLLLAAMLVLLHNSASNLTRGSGQQRVEQEVEVIQSQFERAQQEILASTNRLAASPDLIAAIQKREALSSRTNVFLSARSLRFDAFGLVNAQGARILTAGTSTPAEVAQEEQLLSLALRNTNTIGIVVADDRPRLSLAAVAPLNDALGLPIGALLTSREVNSRFLDEINFSRQSIHLALIHSGQILAHSTTGSGQTTLTEADAAWLLQDTAAISQALNGQTVIRDKLITIDGRTHALGYWPLSAQGQTTVIGILVDVEELVAFQNQVTTTLAVIFTALALAAVGTMALFVRQSVTAPLRKLQSAAERMASGDYQQRAAVATKDEIGRLAQAFNTTVGAVEERETALQQLAASLEQQVEERTTELRRSSEEQVRLQEQIIQMQATALAELSTPLIPISDQIVVMPLIGALDTQRADQILSTLLRGIESSRARVAILDITGVPVVDTQVARTLMSAARAVQLLGAQVMLTGIRPEVAQTLIGLGVDLQGLITHSVLQSGIAQALHGLNGRRKGGA